MNSTFSKRSRRWPLAALMLLVMPAEILAQEAGPKNMELPFAYLVCNEERFRNVRAYRVDLLAGKVSGVSEPIDWIGNPSVVAHNPAHSLLYIGSGRGKSWDYWPITVLRVRRGEFELLDRFTNDPRDGGLPRGTQRTYVEDDGSERQSILNRYLNEVYSLEVSRDGSELYVAHGGLVDTPYFTEVLDPIEGNMLRRLEGPVPNSTYSWDWSPDGTKAAQFYAGEPGLPDTKGTVTLRDVLTGEQLSRRVVKGNRGLQPPWGRIDTPIIVDDGKSTASERAFVLDRDTGEVLSVLNLRKLTGMEDALTVQPNNSWSSVNNNFLHGEGARLAISVMAIVNDPAGIHEYGIRSGHVLLVDALEARTLTHTEMSLVSLLSENLAELSGADPRSQTEGGDGDYCTPLVVAYQ